VLFLDKPVRVGDLCSFGTSKGTVEQIGVRSIQIRALDRTLITIPNAQFADMQIVNWARCDKMLINQTIGLRYETSMDQLFFVLARIRETCHAHPEIDSDTVRIRFSGYGDSALEIDLFIYALTNVREEYFAIREDILLRLINVVEEAGTGFAFPSRAIYMASDSDLDADLAARATAKVQTWRDEERFPFPDFSDADLKRFQGKVDYPPSGSPGYAGPGQEQFAFENVKAKPDNDTET